MKVCCSEFRSQVSSRRVGEIGEARIDVTIYNNKFLAKRMGSQNFLLESVKTDTQASARKRVYKCWNGQGVVNDSGESYVHYFVKV